MKTFELEKTRWTEDDFPKMGWHDSNVYGFVIEKNYKNFTADLVFDIDYIFSWNQPIAPETFYSFFIAPCTLAFVETFDLKINLEIGQAEFELEISDLHLIQISEIDSRKIYEWDIELQQGNITFKSYGYEQFVRKQPIHVNDQFLTLQQRDGINFSRF